ncbi:dpy-19-like 1, like isoform X3 [Leucoraja erinacea]|uniref:dpy-19-like 1, like isoform X3 n=1 Tax=Leucoraja erinaceus TaxID=7782 RepID=UPI002456B322|nr:dpy-19-like 1, like isoform X3 [Leucoraja erinacea]
MSCQAAILALNAGRACWESGGFALTAPCLLLAASRPPSLRCCRGDGGCFVRGRRAQGRPRRHAQPEASAWPAMAMKIRSNTRNSRGTAEERQRCPPASTRALQKGTSPRRDRRKECTPPKAKPGVLGASGKWVSGIGGHLCLDESALSSLGTTILLAIIAGILHWYHIASLFENNRHFSHLSTLEREMAFRTEMGLYYSFFKTIIEAPSYNEGLTCIMNDRLTEYPLVINTLKRFNLYPEVVLSSWYRIYLAVADFLGISTKICWRVDRGHGFTPVDSCEGMGDPAHFYVTFVFLLNGFMMSLFFIYGTYLSRSRLGGVITVACFFFNHGECTRVMWTPPLRESFSYPFLILQMLLLTRILRSHSVEKKTLAAFCIANIFFLLPWQFAQFVLLTQVASLFATYVLGFIDARKLLNIIYAHMISLVVCFMLMFGNAMLLSSYYAASLAVVYGMVTFKSNISQCWPRNVLGSWTVKGFTWIAGTIILKFVASKLLGVTDDAHISNLLKSKFTNYKDFDTLMYTCAVEFDFMELETPLRYTKTLLLPVTVCVFAVIVAKTLKELVCLLKERNSQNIEWKTSVHGEMVYHVFQLLAFVLLGVLIMRLKLFLTPHMCLMASLISSRQFFWWIKNKSHHRIFVCVMLAAMALQGAFNLREQWSIIGEFSNFPQEELLEWIKENTRTDAVFAGAMPTMASIKLSTGRAIVNHPHYEDAGLRARTKLVYAMYSRKSAEEVKKAGLLSLGVDYFIFEESWCLRKTREGCSMPEIWDVEDAENAMKTPLCSVISKSPAPHFTPVFHNDVYKILKMKKSLSWT